MSALSQIEMSAIDKLAAVKKRGRHFDMEERMSQREAKRGQLLALMEAGQISRQEGAKRMGITTRQARRLAQRYRAEGLTGLISRRRGQPSNRRIDEAVKTAALALIGTHYADFGPTLAAEKLALRHEIHLSTESTRQLMIAAGYWRPKRGGKVSVHRMRERRARLGEMIQIDGSPHDWFEGRDERCTLLVFIDDATGQLMQLRFVANETTLDYMQVLHDHILTHGVPVALYSDKHSIFRINAKEADPDAETQFSRAARELDIECIHAHSPQAKGRVERANQTLQDRLVKEMRLAGINDRASANAWLPGFMVEHNRRFAVVPGDARDAHSPYPDTPNALTRILSVHSIRLLSKNLSCQYRDQLLQIHTRGAGLGLRGAKVTLHEHFDGRTDLVWRGHKLNYTVMNKPLRQADIADGKAVNAKVDQAIARRHTSHKPASNHPWKNTPIGKSVPDGRSNIF